MSEQFTSYSGHMEHFKNYFIDNKHFSQGNHHAFTRPLPYDVSPAAPIFFEDVHHTTVWNRRSVLRWSIVPQELCKVRAVLYMSLRRMFIVTWHRDNLSVKVHSGDPVDVVNLSIFSIEFGRVSPPIDDRDFLSGVKQPMELFVVVARNANTVGRVDGHGGEDDSEGRLGELIRKDARSHVRDATLSRAFPW